MVNALTLWTITVIALVLGAFAIVDSIRYYQYKKLGDAVLMTGAEVYWMNPEYFITPTLDSPGGYKAPNPYKQSSTDPTSGSGYYTYALAYNTGMLATYSELNEAFGRGMTVDRWGFFDGQCGINPPSPGNARGKFCAINCCPLSPDGTAPAAPSCSPTSAKKGSNGCSSPPPTPEGDMSPGSTNYCCAGQVPKKGTLCSPCNSPDSNLTTGAKAPLGAPNVILSQCRAWYAENDGVFVACPQANKITTTVPKIPGGPWDADGNGVPQPSPSPGNVNAYQINKDATINFGKSQTPGDITLVPDVAGWKFRMGYETNPPGSTSNPWAGAFVVGVKPPENSSPAAGILPFDMSGQTKNSNNGWNDPNAITAATTIPFKWVPDSQIIVFLIVAAIVSFVFGVMWFRNTNLGKSLLYWV